MTLYESGQKINVDLKQLFNSIPLQQFTPEQRTEILNIIIRFGAVAKFRCRNNTAYDNFVSACFSDIATTSRVKMKEEDEYLVLRAEYVMNGGN